MPITVSASLSGDLKDEAQLQILEKAFQEFLIVLKENGVALHPNFHVSRTENKTFRV